MNEYKQLEDLSASSWQQGSNEQQETVGDFGLEKRQTARAPFVRIVLYSAVVTLVSIIFPMLLHMMGPEQAQDFYTGWALHQTGQLYTNFWGTNGLLYYLLMSITNGGILFAICCWLALVASGVFLFHIAFKLTGQNKQSQQLIPVFYFLTSGLCFGGGYAAIVALPFLFYALSLGATYLSAPTSDKGFIRMGMSLAIAFFIAPLVTILFTFMLFIALFAFNFIRQLLGRGVYQFLSAGVGFSILFYPIGYYTVYKASFGDAIQQILYPITSLNVLSNPSLISNILFYGVVTIGLGGVTLLFADFLQSKPLNQSVLSISAGFMLLLSLIFVVFSTNPIHGSHLIGLLPFLSVLLITTIREKQIDHANRRRRHRMTPSVWARFLKENAYLPFIAIVYLILAPLTGHFLLHPQQSQNQNRLVEMIDQDTKSTDLIYVWDEDPYTYQASQRLAASQLVTPTLYTGTSENRTTLINDLRDNKPKWIVVHTKMNLWTEVDQLLAENYQPVHTDFSDFKIYQLQ